MQNDSAEVEWFKNKLGNIVIYWQYFVYSIILICQLLYFFL